MKLFIVFIIYVFFVGFRYEVGPDWPVYKNIHFFLQDQTVSEILLKSEPFSRLLFWVSQNYGGDMLLTNIVAAAILVFGVFSFARRTVNPWLAIVSATPYLIIAFGMSGIRQAMGVGILLYVLSQWENIRIIYRSAGVIIATLFHSSAIFGTLFLLYAWPGKYNLTIRILIRAMSMLVVGLLTFYLSQSDGIILESFQEYQDRYLDDPDAVLSRGAFFHVGMIILPAVLGYIYRSRIKHLIPNYQIYMLGIMSALGLAPLYLLSTTVTSRLSLYFYFIPMIVYPALTVAFGKRSRLFLTVMVLLAHFLILGTWLLYANNSASHIPYQNVLFK